MVSLGHPFVTLIPGNFMNSINFGPAETHQSHINERTAAVMLSVSVKTLQRWRQNHSGPPYIKLKHLVRYAIQDLQDWMEQYKVGTQNSVKPDTSAWASKCVANSKIFDQGNTND